MESSRPCLGYGGAQALFPLRIVFLVQHPIQWIHLLSPCDLGASRDQEQGVPCRKEVGPGLRIDQKKPESLIFHGF